MKSQKQKTDKICNMKQFFNEHPFLTTLLSNKTILLECDAQAPSPSKDYGQLQINLDQIVLRWWRITFRNVEGSMYPGAIKESHEDFYYDEAAQREIYRIFGPITLNYCLNLIRGQFDWIIRLPLPIQIRIFSFLNLDDIPQLALVCKSFRMLCRHNDLWKIFYGRHYGQNTMKNKDLINLAERQGWRHVFFTNRLKLQMQLRREAQIDRHHDEDTSDVVKYRERRSKIQPSPPITPRYDRFVPPTVRRHSFTTRKEHGNETNRSQIDLVLPSPRKDRLISPLFTRRSTNSDQVHSQPSTRPNSRR